MIGKANALMSTHSDVCNLYNNFFCNSSRLVLLLPLIRLIGGSVRVCLFAEKGLLMTILWEIPLKLDAITEARGIFPRV
jgi:hypothetical protein